MGEVITFYSYKGGTGRSMALSNVACLLAERNIMKKGVLMIDWDLEAPGLHRFFGNRCKGYFQESDNLDKDVDAHLGLIDLFVELNSLTRKMDDITSKDEEELAEILSNYLNIDKYIIKTDIPSLSLLTSGRLDFDYHNVVRNFPWEDLYNRAPQLLLSLISILERKYEYILIDSRTGLTDTSGICTKIMPNKLVIVFTPNRQSLEGAIDIAYQAIEYRRKSDDLRPLVIFPLVSRIDGEEPDLRKYWRFGQTSKDIKGYQPEFTNIFKRAYGMKKLNLNNYFDEVQIQYIPRYSYGEDIAVLEEKSKDRLSLTQSYKNFASWLVGTNSPWGTTPQPIPLMVPPSLADFTGREKELNELVSYFERGSTIVGLRGLGGVGKTALAFKLADLLKDRYPDGQIMVDLKGTSSKPLTPSDAMQQVIRSYYPTTSPLKNEYELRGLYFSLLEGKRVLLILDNASDDRQVRPLLPPSSCGVLITSRRRFALPGLIAFDLDVFSQDKAVEFLFNVYKPNSSQNEYNDERVVWNEIARLCGRLPLALRAAGSLLANTQDLRPSQYAKELGDELRRLARLGNEGVDLDVRASFNLSYVSLSPDTARVFQRISVFPADFDHIAEEYVCRDKDHMHLSELVRWSFVEFKKVEGRYHLHDLVRLFAAEKLEAEGGKADRNDAFQRHAEYFRDVLSSATEMYENGEVLAGLRRFDLERINIEAGWAWAKRNLASNNTAASICSDILDRPYFLELRMPPQERISWLKTALAAARQLKDRRMEGVHLGNLGIAHYDLGETLKAIEYYEQALAIAREVGDRRNEGARLDSLGNAHAELGDARNAIEYHEQALAIAREISDRRAEGNTLDNIGIDYYDLGETLKAIEYLEQHLAIAREIGDMRGEGKALGNRGLAYYDLGDALKAIDSQKQSLVIARKIGDRHAEGANLVNLGRSYANIGDARRAMKYLEQALAIAHDIGDKRSEGFALWNTGLTLHNLGEQSGAIEKVERALKIFEQIGSPLTVRVRQELAELKK